MYPRIPAGYSRRRATTSFSPSFLSLRPEVASTQLASSALSAAIWAAVLGALSTPNVLSSHPSVPISFFLYAFCVPEFPSTSRERSLLGRQRLSTSMLALCYAILCLLRPFHPRIPTDLLASEEGAKTNRLADDSADWVHVEHRNQNGNGILATLGEKPLSSLGVRGQSRDLHGRIWFPHSG